MLNSQIFLKKLALMSVGVVMMTLLVTTAKADDRVVRNYSFDLDDIDTVEFSNAVGSFEIMPSRDDRIYIVLEIEGKRKGIFRRKVDVEDMDLESRERGNTLFLSFEEDDTNAQWSVEMPSVERTIIQMGVGEITLDLDSTELDVELGVGDVNIEAPRHSVGRINVNVGVGDASVHGADVIKEKTAFISNTIRAEGEGELDMEVNLGVGDVDISLL